MEKIEINKIMNKEGMLSIELLERNKLKSYMVCDVLTYEEVERLALCSGYIEGEKIIVYRKEGRKPQRAITTNSVSDAWDVVFDAPLEDIFIEIISEKLYVWRDWDDEFFVVFGNKSTLKNCVDIEELRKVYFISTKDGFYSSDEMVNILRQASLTYNTLEGTQMEEPEV